MLVCFVSLMHLLWGLLLLVNQGALDITATSVFADVLPNYSTRAWAYIISALLPIILLIKPGSTAGLLSALPQQLLLILSGVSAIVAIAAGSYADGEARSRAFIASDQAIYIILAVLYALESLDRYQERE